MSLTRIGIVGPVHTEEINTSVQQQKIKYLNQLDVQLQKLHQVIQKGKPIKIFISHLSHEDALSTEDRSNSDLLQAARYYDSYYRWLYETLGKAGFSVIFEIEKRSLSQTLDLKQCDDAETLFNQVDIILSICTPLYIESASSARITQEIHQIHSKIVRDGVGDFIALLLHYNPIDTLVLDLLPEVLKNHNPKCLDVSNKHLFVSNLWNLFSELFHTKAIQSMPTLLKLAYVEVLNDLQSTPDTFDLATGEPISNEDIQEQKASGLKRLYDSIPIDTEQGWIYKSLLKHPFYKLHKLSFTYPTPKCSKVTPYRALILVLGERENQDSEDISSNGIKEICNLIFHSKISDESDMLFFQKWINTDTTVSDVLPPPVVSFNRNVHEGCVLYGVHYLWFMWLYLVTDSLVYDADSLNYLSHVFTVLHDCITVDETNPLNFHQIKERLRERGESSVCKNEDTIERGHIYQQRLCAISNETLDGESAARMFHLVSLLMKLDGDDLQSNCLYDGWRVWGNQYLDYFFMKKKLSIEDDQYARYYLNWARQLGCRPSSEQWHGFIDQMLSCNETTRRAEDEGILLTFILKLGVDMMQVMRSKDSNDQTIVEKLAEYFMKYKEISPSSRETYREIIKVCPDLEWHVTISNFLPKHLLNDHDHDSEQIVSISGQRFLPKTSYLQLFDSLNHRFHPKESNHKTGFKDTNGRGTVGYLQNASQINTLCFKIHPEFPIIEQAGLGLMYRLFGYPGIAFSETIRLNKSLFLVSEYIPGIRADEVFNNDPHNNSKILSNLDKRRVGELIIYSILSNPEDGRLQNYIFTPSDCDSHLYKIVAIDNDHSFAAAIPQKLPGWFGKETQTSSILFTLPLMNEPIATTIQERFMKLNVDELFSGWLNDLESLEKDHQKLFAGTEGREEYEKNTTLTLPLNYARLMQVYSKLNQLKSLLIENAKNQNNKEPVPPTYMEILKRLEKYTGDRYDTINQSNLSAQKRIKRSDGRVASSMDRSEFVQILERQKENYHDRETAISKARRTLQERESTYQEEEDADLEGFEKIKMRFESLSSTQQEELFVTHHLKTGKTSEKEIDPNLQRQWLELIAPYVGEWQHLSFRHYSILTKNWFTDSRTTFYNLSLLELHHCSEITGEVLDILSSQKSCRLERVILSSLDNLRTVCARGVLGRQMNKPLELPDLKSIRLMNNNNLKRVHLNTKNLNDLVVESCPQIDRISFGEGNHSLHSFRYDQLTVLNEPSFAKEILTSPIFQQCLKRRNVENYLRFINGKLIFHPPPNHTNNNDNIARREFPFYEFAKDLNGAFNLSGLETEYGNVSQNLSIHIGYRTEKLSSNQFKSEVWIIPKFIIETAMESSSTSPSVKHLEWYLERWTSPVGIFYMGGDWDDYSGDSFYQTKKTFEDLHNQSLETLYDTAKSHTTKYFNWNHALSYFSLEF